MISGISFGQDLSPLIAPLTTNQLIDRPLLFRDLQNNLSTEIGSVKPGLQVNYLNKKLKDLRALSIDKIGKIKLVLESSDNLNYKLILRLGGELSSDITIIEKVNLNDISVNKIFDNLEVKLDFFINEKIFEKAFAITELNNKTYLKNTILKLTFTFLKNSDLSGNIFGLPSETEDNIDDKDLQENLSKLISMQIINYVKNKINLYINLDQIPNGENNTKLVIENINEQIQNVTGIINTLYSDAEREIFSLVDKFSKTLVSGNIGLAISQGSGNFSGGIQFAWNFSSVFQGGAYLNGQFNGGDSTKPMNSLVALQTRYAPFNNFEFDAVISAYFGDRNFKSFTNYEFGGGMSWNPTSTLIFGVTYFKLVNSSSSNSSVNGLNWIQTLGLYVKSTDKTLPAIVFGRSWQNDTSDSFGFQIVYPINQP